MGTDDSGMGDIEPMVREELGRRLGTEVDVTVYEQGDSVDVNVSFPDLMDDLDEVLDGRSVQTYSTLKFTVSRR